ncbi:MAG: amidohydrolase family protein, partial [Sphingomicrobium sp.]
LEELRAAREEAHRAGTHLAVHATNRDATRLVVEAGVDTIEHASLVDDEGIRLAVQRKQPVWFAMDIYNTDYTQAEGKKNGVLDDNLRKDREIAQIQRDNFRKSHRAGVKMVFGSDAGVMPHGQVGRQFRTMVTYGMTPLEAIQAATRNGAEALGRRDLGVIAVGRFGDFVAVTGDPTRDVTLLERPAAVVKGGVLIPRP